MLTFQHDYDDRTGQNVVTCFLLPQQAYQPESMGKITTKMGYLRIKIYNCHDRLELR